jgi:hypothetical protein
VEDDLSAGETPPAGDGEHTLHVLRRDAREQLPLHRTILRRMSPI